MKILIIGYGITGKSIYDFFKKSNNDIYVYDNKKEVNVDYNYNDLKRKLPLFDLGIKSPGIRDNSKEYNLIKILCKDIISELDFAYQFLKSPLIIGVTGSNGKTTCATFIAHLLSSKYRVHLLGNIGRPLISEIDNILSQDIIVLELSSFQIEDIKKMKLDYLIYTSLSPNHLDQYYSKSHYYASKKRALLFTKKVISLFDDDCLNVHKINFQDFDIENENLIGFNNIYAKCAIYLAREFGIEERFINEKVSTLKPIEYRLNKPYQIRNFYVINDSKSTTCASTIYAYNIYKDFPLIVIIGGRHKSDSFNKLKTKNEDVVLIYGKDRNVINKQIEGLCFETLEDVVRYIDNIREERYILFSPGCDSHDQFKNYIDRGEKFEELINKYLGDNAYE